MVERLSIAVVTLCSLLLFGCGGDGYGATPPTLPLPLGNDASLSSLSESSGTLNPAFSPAVTNYTATVLFGSNSVDVSATTSDSNASFLIDGSGRLVERFIGPRNWDEPRYARALRRLLDAASAAQGGERAGGDD